MAIVYARTTHREAHFTGSETVRDIVIGMSDGLTVPFALAAGLSGAVNDSFVVLVAGVAEMAAGSMAMGLGGYLAARSEADSYSSELARERAEVRAVPDAEAQEVRDIFRGYGLRGDALLAFGAAKARFTGVPMLRGAIQTALVGGVAAAVAYGLAPLVGQLGA